MAKPKVLIPCAMCGSSLNKNGHCEVCRREWREIGKKIICYWCDSEITDNEKRGYGDEEGIPIFHLDCLAEREYIHEFIEYINKHDGLLSLIFADADKIRKKEEDKDEPPLVTGILVQMKATKWELGSIIFDTEPCHEEKDVCDNVSASTEIVLVEDPKEVKEIISEMDREDWHLSSIIFDTSSDEEDETPQ